MYATAAPTAPDNDNVLRTLAISSARCSSTLSRSIWSSIISRSVVDAFLQFGDYRRGYVIVLDWLGFRRSHVEVEHHERAVGTSSYTTWGLLGHALTITLTYSEKPLRLSIYLGLVLSTLSFLLGLWLASRYFTTGVGQLAHDGRERAEDRLAAFDVLGRRAKPAIHSADSLDRGSPRWQGDSVFVRGRARGASHARPSLPRQAKHWSRH